MSTVETELLRALVPVMRELGVAQAYGITLGPVPTPLQRAKLEAEKRPTDPSALQELAEQEREERIAAAREDMRNQLAATDDTYSDEQIDRLLDPQVFR